MSETSTDLAIPISGEVVDLNDYKACSLALANVRYIESEFREVKAALSRAIAEEAARLGTKTLELEDGRKVHVEGGTETEYDSEAIMEGLLAAGMPPERVAVVVRETVQYKVSAVEAKRAANANALYATVIDENSREVEKPVSISIRRS